MRNAWEPRSERYIHTVHFTCFGHNLSILEKYLNIPGNSRWNADKVGFFPLLLKQSHSVNVKHAGPTAKSCCFPLCEKTVAVFFLIIYNSHSQNLWKITDKHVVYFCVVLVLYSVQDTLTVTGDSSLICACSTAKHQSGRKSRRAPLMLQAARCFLLWLSLTKVIMNPPPILRRSSNKLNEPTDPPAKKLPVCSVLAVKQVCFGRSSAFFFSCLFFFLPFFFLTFCATWVTQWEVQLLRSGPLEHQVPATVQRKEATPAATQNNKPSGRRERGRRLAQI